MLFLKALQTPTILRLVKQLDFEIYILIDSNETENGQMPRVCPGGGGGGDVEVLN